MDNNNVENPFYKLTASLLPGRVICAATCGYAREMNNEDSEVF